MIDRELHDVDVAMRNSNRDRFVARRVLGADSPLALAEHVRTAGWEPVDARLKVSDVPRLVQLLGGAHLYGDDNRVPIRELIQNSADAVRARRLQEPGFGKRGYVRVRLVERSGHIWLEVEDNGVGMSRETLTESLLDFGKSFWTTDSVKREFPGLLAKGMSPTGRFGIGFFSVFMISHVVHVTSKRYDHALDSTGILEFRSGLSLRPILRPASDEEVIHDGGTRVSARLDEAFLSKEGYLARSGWIDKRGRPDLARLVQAICPNVDVNVQVEHGGLISDCVSAGDWTDMPGDLLLSRLTKPNSSGAQLRTYGNLLRPLTDGTVLYGRACVLGFGPYYWNADIGGVVTVGGLAASELSGIGGVLVGSTDVVTRDQAVPDVPFSVLRLWADEQGRLVAQSDLSEDEKLCAAAVVMKCGGSPGALPVCTSGGDYLNAGQLRSLFSNEQEVVVFEGSDVDYDKDTDDCHPNDFEHNFEADPDLVFVSTFDPAILRAGNRIWPEIATEGEREKGSPFWHLLNSIAEREFGESCLADVQERVVGHVDDVEIKSDVRVFYKAERD